MGGLGGIIGGNAPKYMPTQCSVMFLIYFSDDFIAYKKLVCAVINNTLTEHLHSTASRNHRQTDYRA